MAGQWNDETFIGRILPGGTPVSGNGRSPTVWSRPARREVIVGGMTGFDLIPKPARDRPHPTARTATSNAAATLGEPSHAASSLS